MVDINDYAFIGGPGEETFYTDDLTDEELISLVEQTGVQTVTVELVFVPAAIEKWVATTSLNQQFRYGWADMSPLRAIAGAVILCYLGEREWNEHADAQIAQAESSGNED